MVGDTQTRRGSIRTIKMMIVATPHSAAFRKSFPYVYIHRSNFTHVRIGGYATRNLSGGGGTSDRRKIAGVRDFPRV